MVQPALIVWRQQDEARHAAVDLVLDGAEQITAGAGLGLNHHRADALLLEELHKFITNLFLATMHDEHLLVIHQLAR